MDDRRSTLSRWADRRHAGNRPWGRDPEAFRPACVLETLVQSGRLFGPHRWFDLRTDGWTHVPDRPVLLVANHSGGTTVPDVWGLLASWYAHFGVERPLYVLGHELLFTTDATARFFAQRGVLRASREAAEEVVARGADLLVTPGGERDVWRRWTERWTVKFAGRTGYAQLALAHGLPVVPVAGAGAHHTLLVLADGHRLARAVGLNRAARAEIWPLHLSVPWGLAFGPWPHVPVPQRLWFRVAEPIPAVGAPGDPVAVAALDIAVRASLQRELDALKQGWKAGRRGVREVVRDVAGFA